MYTVHKFIDFAIVIWYVSIMTREVGFSFLGESFASLIRYGDLLVWEELLLALETELQL